MMSVIQVHTIGTIALQVLEPRCEGVVMGVSSRGVFLNLASGWTVFLSYEPYHGPLTINLADGGTVLARLHPGDAVRVLSGRISLPSINKEISYTGTPAWEAPEIRVSRDVGSRIARSWRNINNERVGDQPRWSPCAQRACPTRLGIYPSDVSQQKPTKNKDKKLARRSLFKDLAIFASARFKKSHQGLLPLLLDSASPQENRLISTARPFYQRAQEALHSGQAGSVADALAGFLGLGAGLTPCGDDLAIGFLLAANRWGGRLSLDLDLQALNAAVIACAQRQTTTLSTSLIRCASLGQADERLILALDGLAIGAPELEACAAALASWGNTSGFDAFVGMALASRDS